MAHYRLYCEKRRLDPCQSHLLPQFSRGEFYKVREVVCNDTVLLNSESLLCFAQFILIWNCIFHL